MKSGSAVVTEKLGRTSSYVLSLAAVPGMLVSPIAAPPGQPIHVRSVVTSAASTEGAEIERRVLAALASLRPTEVDLKDLQQLYFEPVVTSVRRHRMRVTKSRPQPSLIEDERELQQLLGVNDL